NYDDQIYTSPPSVSWVGLSPANNSVVSGTITLEIDISEDIGIYIAILSVNFDDYILEDSNNDRKYIFNYDTMNSFDGKTYFIVEAWDYEGHLTSSLLILEIDNIATGEPPIISIIQPHNDETISGQYTIQVSVQDDIGVKAVTMKINNYESLVMKLNSQTNYYEYQLDTTKYDNGQYTLSITALDDDDNTHRVTEYITINISNEDENGSNTIKLPGFNYILTIASLIPVSLIIYLGKKRRR
ncbi:MAG: Ig-like domain-containing protein, partial [Candidatus Heimdallarchaeaceae archaeon]